MATANVVLKIEGLDALKAYVERLETAIEQVREIGRPLYGDVHIHGDSIDPQAVIAAMNRVTALDGIERGKQ